MSSGLLISVLVGGLGVGGAVGYVAGTGTAGRSGSSSASSGGDTAWFTYEGKTYNTSSLPAQTQTNLYQAEMETYNQKIAVVREFAVRLALAQEQKKFTSIDKLPAIEELLPASAVSDDQAKAFFEANKDKIPPGTTYEQLAGRIKELLGNEGRAKTFEETWQKLTTGTGNKLTLLVKEPQAPVVNVPVAGFPARGANDDKNVVVEISDYLCPHCQEVQPDMKKLMDSHKNIKFVQINFALRPDKLSGAMIEGAFCAGKQGNESFWKFHDAAFSKPWGSFADAYDVEKVKPIAEAAGVKVPDWEACMKTDEPKQFVNKTKDIVNGLGVTGTPTFYLNNKRLNIRSPQELAAAVEKDLVK